MLQKTRTSSRKRRNEPKVFQCTGFGDCSMVFSRSEHLARHARKHTGEKPYKCIVANCDRTFSRIDNMMQHTHTHSRSKKKGPSDESNIVPEDNLMISAPSTSPKMQFQPCNIIPSPIYDPRQIQEHLQFYPPVFMPYHLWPYPSPNTSPLSFVEQKKEAEKDDTYFQKLQDPRYVDVSTPIQQLAHSSEPSSQSTPVSADEYEALEGFSQFCAKPREYKQVPMRLQLSQLYDFRHHIHLVQESFSRKSHFG